MVSREAPRAERASERPRLIRDGLRGRWGRSREGNETGGAADKRSRSRRREMHFLGLFVSLEPSSERRERRGGRGVTRADARTGLRRRTPAVRCRMMFAWGARRAVVAGRQVVPAITPPLSGGRPDE